MNVVVLLGRLTQDPTLRTTQSGKNLCRFTVAVDRRYKQDGQPTADFISCTAWNRTAEVICQYLKKGNQICLQGRIQTGSYQAQDGTMRYTTDVIVESFDFVGSRNDNQYNNNYQNNFNQQNQMPNNQPYNQGGYNNAPQNQAPLEIDDDFSLLDDDDEVPF